LDIQGDVVETDLYDLRARAREGGGIMDSLHEIAIAASSTRVFAAWTTEEGLRAWWTGDCSVPNRSGEPYVFRFDSGRVAFHFAVEEEVQGERVLWRGIEGPGMPAEWVGTRIDVRLTRTSSDRTRMQFAHRDWRSIEGAYCSCNTTWGELVYRLRDWCEGRPRGPLFTG
jgi:uncharacterized protein YndB with AHSA1/START domain